MVKVTNNSLYLGDAFGWDTESTAKVAIAQLRKKGTIRTDKCPKAQLIKNESLRWQPNILKIFGYIPVINIIAGIIAIASSESDDYGLGPNHTSRWNGRGVAMIFTGPILLVVDLIVYVSNRSIAKKYSKEHADLIKAFDTKHEHTIAYHPGHPIYCKK